MIVTSVTPQRERLAGRFAGLLEQFRPQLSVQERICIIYIHQDFR